MSFRKKKRIAIATLFSQFNFGNRLQNYAVQKYFETLGFDVYKIPYQPRNVQQTGVMKSVKQTVHFWLQFVGFEKTQKQLKENKKKREEYIGNFTEEYIKVIAQFDLSMLHDLCLQYDYFVTGSDQVWHCWTGESRELEYYFLTFVRHEQRLTIAPSFGMDAVPWELYEVYDAAVLLDPTMLVDTLEWYKILKKPKLFVKQKYILIYALGVLDNSLKEKIDELAQKNNLAINRYS